MRASAREIARLGVLLAAILVLGLAERQFPPVSGVPGIRLGLSNAVILYALSRMGFRQACALTLLKALLGGLAYAGFSGACYSLGGGACAVLVMFALLRARGMGLVGASVGGACAHSLGQVAVSRAFLGSWAAALQLPLLLVASVAAGIATGVACRALIAALNPVSSPPRTRGGHENEPSGGAKG